MKKICPGFTLIEILISISVIAILSGIGITAFTQFNRRQLVVSSARKLITDLRLAQSKADSSEKPADCTGDLLSYQVDIDHSARKYSIIPNCAQTIPPAVIKTVSLPQVVTTSGLTRATFKLLRQGVVVVGGSTINLNAYGIQHKIILGPGGEISTE